MPFAVSHGARIYYRLEGSPEKPLLVLVHALGTDHGLWDPQMPALLRSFQVLRPDVRGHGASDAPAGDYTIQQLAEDILATIPRERFNYCGLSLGGMIGQWVGAHHSNRLEHLMLANTSARMADPGLFDARRESVLNEGMSAVADAVMQRFFSHRNHPAADTIRTTLLTTNPIGYAGCCAAIRNMDHRELLPSIAVPVLVIGGENDASTPWSAHGEVIASRIPRARTAKIDAAHLSNVERPSAFTAALFDFLRPSCLGAGIDMRRTVLGNDHVDRAIANTTDLTREFQDLITRYAWGEIWTRPGLDIRTRRLLTLAMTAALGRWEEFRLHVRTGLNAELEPVDLKEALLQVAIYAGVPAANMAFRIAQEILG